MRRSLSVVILALCVVTMLFAKGSTAVSATSTFWAPTLNGSSAGFGVTGDGGIYQNKVGAVQSFWGSNGTNYSLVTYSTGRYLNIKGSSGDAAVWAKANLPLSGTYQVDFYGINYYGPYSTMGPGTTAQVHGVLQFHYQSNTYQLDFQTLAVMRDSGAAVYHFYSDLNSLPGFPGFWPDPTATLSLVRSRGNVNYGTITVPIKFDVQ